MADNLLALKQIRQTELSGYIVSVQSGTISGMFAGYTGALGTATSGIESHLAAGVTTVTLSYNLVNIPKIYTQVGCSGSSVAPIINSFVSMKNLTGCQIDLSAATPVTGYYLDVLFKL